MSWLSRVFLSIPSSISSLCLVLLNELLRRQVNLQIATFLFCVTIQLFLVLLKFLVILVLFLANQGLQAPLCYCSLMQTLRLASSYWQ